MQAAGCAAPGMTVIAPIGGAAHTSGGSATGGWQRTGLERAAEPAEVALSDGRR